MINSVTVLIASINMKGLNIRYRKKKLTSTQWKTDLILDI